MGPEAQQGRALPDITPGVKQEEDEEEEQPGDWAVVVVSGTFRQQVLTASLGAGCDFNSLLYWSKPHPLLRSSGSLIWSWFILAKRDYFTHI